MTEGFKSKAEMPIDIEAIKVTLKEILMGTFADRDFKNRYSSETITEILKKISADKEASDGQSWPEEHWHADLEAVLAYQKDNSTGGGAQDTLWSQITDAFDDAEHGNLELDNPPTKYIEED